MGNARSKRKKKESGEDPAPGNREKSSTTPGVVAPSDSASPSSSSSPADGKGGGLPSLTERVKAEDAEVISRVASRTRYTIENVQDLYMRFKEVAEQTPEHPDQITREQFNNVLDEHDVDWRSDSFSKRLFTFFDKSNEGTINFTEFVRGLSVLSNATPRDKLKFSFEMYDLEGSGRIAKWEMKNILSGIFASGESALPSQGVSASTAAECKARIAGFVDKVYEDYDKDRSGSLTFMEYMQAAMKHPGLKDFMNGTGAFDTEAGATEPNDENGEQSKDQQEERKSERSAPLDNSDTSAVATINDSSHVRKKFDPEIGWTADEVKVLKSRFDDLDRQSSESPGAITRDQFRAVLDAYAVDWRNDAFLNRIFDAVDVSGSYTIQWRECLAGMSALLRTGSVIDRLELSFSVYDTDGTERISRSEMTAVLQAHRFATRSAEGSSDSGGAKLSEDNSDIQDFVDKVFAESDKDHSGTLSLREYINAGIKFQGLMDFSAN